MAPFGKRRDRNCPRAIRGEELDMKNSPTKPCPICDAAMVRMASDDSLIVHHCYGCATQVVMPTPRTRDRRRIVSPDRRAGACRASGFFDCRQIVVATPSAFEATVRV